MNDCGQYRSREGLQRPNDVHTLEKCAGGDECGLGARYEALQREREHRLSRASEHRDDEEPDIRTSAGTDHR